MFQPSNHTIGSTVLSDLGQVSPTPRATDWYQSGPVRIQYRGTVRIQLSQLNRIYLFLECDTLFSVFEIMDPKPYSKKSH